MQTTQTVILPNAKERWKMKVHVNQEKTEAATKTGVRRVQLRIGQDRNRKNQAVYGRRRGQNQVVYNPYLKNKGEMPSSCHE